MSTDNQLNLLIAKAGAIVGSEYRLAKELGIPQHHLSEWKAGRRNCTPADRARLAAFAREDAVQELVRSTIAAAKGIKREQLMQALGKLSRQTGGALRGALLSLASAAFGMSILDVPRCISSENRS